MLRKGFDSLRGRVFGGRKVREYLAGLAEGDTGAMLEDLGDAAILGRKRRGVVFQDFGVVVSVEVGYYCDKF